MSAYSATPTTDMTTKGRYEESASYRIPEQPPRAGPIGDTRARYAKLLKRLELGENPYAATLWTPRPSPRRTRRGDGRIRGPRHLSGTRPSMLSEPSYHIQLQRCRTTRTVRATQSSSLSAGYGCTFLVSGHRRKRDWWVLRVCGWFLLGFVLTFVGLESPVDLGDAVVTVVVSCGGGPVAEAPVVAGRLK